MNNISAVIVVKDKPLHLFECLDSIEDFVEEIIIVDIGTDDILIKELQQNRKITIISYKKDVSYVELIREKCKQYCKNDFILFLDPDEIIPLGLKEILIKEYRNHDYVSIPRKNIIFNKWIQNTRWWPDYQIRLFKKNATIWPKEIHKQPSATGKNLIIPPKEENAIIHYNYRSLDEFLLKAMRYAKSEAKSYVSLNKNLTLSTSVRKAVSEFISRFFSEKGYRDGTHGFVLSVLQMMYYFMVFFYYWELKKYPEYEQKVLIQTIHDYFQDGLFETNHWMNETEKFPLSQNLKNKVVNKFLKMRK